MKPVWFVIAAVILAALLWRRRRLGRIQIAGGLLLAACCAVYGTGVVHLPNLEHTLVTIGQSLGPWTYVLVGVLAFAETGAFIGLVAPGETAIVVGGVVAGQGEIDIIALIAVVWACAVAGDVTSFYLGRRLGREFLVRHGARVQITPERLVTVEGFFDRHGGKAIFLGRFVGLVRAIAPFLAGSSGMSFRRFAPYDILGAGLWGTTFCLLGFVFWRSLSQVLSIAKQGALALGIVIAIVVGIVVLVRWLRVEDNRARLLAEVERQEARPLLGPLVRLGRRCAAWLRGPARFLWARVTPGDLGLELTTLAAVAAVGSFTFFGYLIVLERGTVETAGDARVIGWVLDLRDAAGLDLARAVSTLGAFPLPATAIALAAAWCVRARRFAEALVLAGGFLLTWLAVTVTKEWVARPRPSIATYDAIGLSYPSGHAAHAVAWVAIAVILTRLSSRRTQITAVTAAIAVALLVGASRLYLGVHYLSDVLGGYGVAAMIYAVAGMTAMVVVRLRQTSGTG